MKKNKIIYISGARFPDGTASAQRILANAKLFSELNYEVILAGKSSNNKEKNAWFKANGYDVFNLSSHKGSINLSINFLDQILEKHSLESIYAIIAYNYPGVALNKLNTFCKKHNIIMIADLTEWYAFSCGRNILNSLLHKLLVEYSIRYVNKKIRNIICSSVYLSHFYNKYNTMLNPNVIDTEESKWSRNCHPLKVNKIRQFMYAGSPGVNMKKDAIDLIVGAFLSINEDINPYQLNIIGITLDQFIARFPQYKQPLYDKNCVNFMGRVTHQQVLDRLKRSEFSIVFRRVSKVTRAGFATKISEAISCGTIIIANDPFEEISRYIKDGQHGLLTKTYDFHSLRTLIIRAINIQSSELISMKRNCLKNNLFSTKHFFKSTEKFLKEAERNLRND